MKRYPRYIRFILNRTLLHTIPKQMKSKAAAKPKREKPAARLMERF
jgi:hypothetical protein